MTLNQELEAIITNRDTGMISDSFAAQMVQAAYVRIQAENMARIASAAYQRQERKVARVERSIRRSAKV